jgi:hypothetical protein
MNHLEDQHLESELRAALQRKDPPLGFTARVLAKTSARPSHRRLWWATAAVAAGVMVMSISMASVYTARYRQQREERAGRQALAALQIASEKLTQARDRALRMEASPANTTAGAESGKKDN